MIEQKQTIRKLESADLLKQVMTEYFGRLKEASITQNKKIAWCTSVGPAELLYSMGFEVYFPENHAAMIGVGKIADQCIPFAVAHGYSPDICSYLTTDIGAFLKNETPLKKFGFTSVPKPDVLVYNTNQCADVQHWFSFYADHFHVPLVGIHTPLRVDKISFDITDYIDVQYHHVLFTLEDITKKHIDIDKFREAVELSHQACVLWRQVLETARHKPSPLSFFDATIHMGPVVVMRGTPHAVHYYEMLLKELQKRIENQTGAVSNEKHRLYWEGMPLWFKLKDMSELFARLNCCVVASTYCNSWVFDDLDSNSPFYSSALAYTKLFIVRSDEIKENILMSLFKDYSVDGIIFHDAKTCPRNSNNHYGLPNRIHKKTNIPYLEIQGDLNDARCYSEAQSAIAIETFIQQLEMRK